jgi:adhesin transport system membrane fusion protein
MPMPGQAAQGIGLGERLQRLCIEPGTAREVFDVGEGPALTARGDDALRRTTLVSPVRGIVKQIRANTLGGVIAAGAPVMEIVPLGERVLVEARILPSDIGFIQVGQPVEIKLSAYEYTVYGSLRGTVHSISPDALGDPERASQPDGTWYRALVRADTAALELGERRYPVLPGMNGTAEIRTGQRSVLAFLLRPMLKSQEAFRER